MISNELIRQQLPSVEVYVEQADKTLVAASQMLTDEVAEDLNRTRTRIVDAFGGRSIPPIDTELGADIESYFSDRQWNLPQSVVIDPESDALALRHILQAAKFCSVGDEEFFTGANGQTMSPGGSAERDLVIFHDWRPKYHREIRELVEEWGYTIADDLLKTVAELKTADFIVHELAHLAGGLAVTAVVVKKTDGKYHLADRAMAGFTDIRDNVLPPDFDGDSGYYTGPALDESWAALNASRFVSSHSLAKEKDEEASMPHGYGIVATIKDEEGEEMDYAVGALHSWETGVIIEKVDELYPGVIAIMTEVADGETSLSDAMDRLRATLPRNMMKLLNTPEYSAWQKLNKQLKV